MIETRPNQCLDDRLVADAEFGGSLVDFSQHPGSEVNAHATQGPNNGELIRKVFRNILTP